MMGTEAISGSVATMLRKLVITASLSIRPSSMLTSMRLAPLRTCSRATSTAPSRSLAVISRRNLAEPVTLVRSPTITRLEEG